MMNIDEYWLACIQQPTVGDGHFWLVQTDLTGNMQSNQTYENSAHHSSTSIIITKNGDLALTYSSRDSGEHKDVLLMVLNNMSSSSIFPIILGLIVVIVIILFLLLYFKRKKFRI
ncbi:LPXTG cell wall anchor domain-containing protein [Candidatus Bathyarchaeota archaeon]|nr:LPXTG cell wall anchor domain-containing protein [Candidatus Bathyarchaeota archaeon]